MPVPRLFDARSAEMLSTLHARAVEDSLWLSLDFHPQRGAGTAWLIQVFDHSDSTVVTGRGATFAEAVAAVHERFFAKFGDVGV